MRLAAFGAITHQLVSAIRNRPAARGTGFVARYTSVNQRVFTNFVIGAYAIGALLGGIIYPDYRLNTRPSFEQMSLGWAIGTFELKEHFAGLGLCFLPLYAWLWKPERADGAGWDRVGITALLAFTVWWDFLIGHVLNNIRGLGA